MRAFDRSTGVGCARSAADSHRRRRRVADWGWILALCLVSSFIVPTPVAGENLEAAVKTGLLLKLSLYIQYPEGTFASPDSPFEICVVEAQALEPILEQLTHDRVHKEHRIEVRRLEDSEVQGGCQVLYFGQRTGSEVGALLERIGSEPMLTVGDGEDFLDDGGAIRLMRVGKNLRFAIDRDAIDRAGLVISSSVLKLAEEVRGGQGAGRRERRER